MRYHKDRYFIFIKTGGLQLKYGKIRPKSGPNILKYLMRFLIDLIQLRLKKLLGITNVIQRYRKLVFFMKINDINRSNAR